MDAGLTFRLDEEAQMHRVAIAYNLPPQELDYIHFAFRQGVPGWVLEHATALIVPDARADPRVHPLVVEQGILANALDYFLAVLGRRRGGERLAPFRVERLDYRNQDRVALHCPVLVCRVWDQV
jgi:hypothetical protein